MDLKISNSNPAFAAKFINNKAFREVVEYAQKTNQLSTLDGALHTLSKANNGDILIVHGKTGTGVSFSNLICNKRTSLNHCKPEEEPACATFKGIINLAELDVKFRKLFGSEAKSSVTAESIIDNYTAKISV